MDEQFERMRAAIKRTSPGCEAKMTRMSNGGVLVEVPGVDIKGAGWNRETANILFVVPPGYPMVAPDCFWVEPNNFRLASGATPQASNEASPIPGDFQQGRQTTWFSWHVQGWSPNNGTLYGYYNLILNRLKPAR